MDLEKIKKHLKRHKKKFKRRKREEVGEINFDDLDKYGADMWIYSPTPKTRKNLLKILSRSTKNKQRKALVEKIGKEFQKIYVNYRQIDSAARRKQSVYILSKAYVKDFQLGAVQCLEKGIDLKQLIQYWHVNVHNFASGAKIPAPTLITSLKNIESAACALMEEGESYKTRQSAKEKREDWVASRNSFSDLKKLDPKVREGLKKVKFKNIGRYSDKELLTAQILARDVSEGFDVYMEPKVRPIVKWIVKNIYGEGK